MRKILILMAFFTLVNTYSQSRKNIEDSGDVIQIILPSAAGLSTLIWNDDSKPIWQFAKAYGLSFLTTYSFKRIINKRRPNGGIHAFPSGHTSTSFTGAAFLERRFGWKVGIPAYILAGYVGWTRIHAKKHDGWDVFAGAIVGIGSSYLFAKPYQKRSVDVTFQKNSEGTSVGLLYSF
ncbi:phosphatase PAP2 family protein [Pseudotenacibaculum haliotis]|uniref:Phosphatase PAP2 family protein n=1 Tax=Pseudotenacibaculum haliotis TaxID=1862138 RepID=A0ABW5LSK8_9FLAO